MENLIFIGTLHANLTPHEELQKTLNNFRPEQLLVEIAQKDIDKNNLRNYPDEMIFALTWARENNIPVFGYDVNLDVFVSGKTEADNQTAIKEQKKILNDYSWKDANRSEINAKLNTPKTLKLIDVKKYKEREEKMLENISKISALSQNKITIILTGAAHLDFFERHYPKAKFPFRIKNDPA